MMETSLKFAVEHSDIIILNCSLNTPHKNIRTYYARMYEAKFISGMIAGAMAENDKIAYVADNHRLTLLSCIPVARYFSAGSDTWN